MKRLPTALAVSALAVLACAAPAKAAPHAFPGKFFAPYVDTGLSNVTLTDVATSYGTKYFTLAFVDGAGCQWSMPNSSGWQQQVNDLRAAGGDVIISFGGWGSDNGGTDLGATCSSPEAMAAQIEDVVTTFDVTRLDFDIEAAAISNATDIDRTTRALAQVRAWAGGRSLALDYTIPTFPTGLGDDGVKLLNASEANGFTPDVVNVMSMDYGTSGTEMGDAANSAVDAAAGQVAAAFGKSGADAAAMMGNTPMIGQNDSAGEVFTLDDAASVVSHAQAKGIAMVSFWSEGRDNGGCAGAATASSTCSGISQGDGDFTKAFQKF
jgi:chitinase